MAMFGFGKPRPAVQEAPLGTALVALRVHGDVRLPPGCVELVFSAAGLARRAPHSRAGKGEVALAYHPGPYETAFAPFAGAPEIGLRLRYLADAADPRVAQQRFDLFLFSEAGEALPVEALHQAIAAAVRDALAQGTLELPACTTLDEWHGFRAGLNELLYTRFGLTVDDCVPVDLGDVCDYAALLRARAARAADAAGAAIRIPARGLAPGHAGYRDGGVAADPAADLSADLAGAAAGITESLPATTSADTTRSAPRDAVAPAAPAGTRAEAVATAHTGTRDAAVARVPAGPWNAAPAKAPPGKSDEVAATAAPATWDAAAATAHSGKRDAADAMKSPGARGAVAAAMHPAPWDAPVADAQALRRLFLELPAWSAGVRLLALPAAAAAARRDVLQRCALAALDVNTMPALAWAAPNRPLAAASQARRAAHSVAAAQALDQAWALLARWRLATRGAAAATTEGAAVRAALSTQAAAAATTEDATVHAALSTQGGATAGTESAAVHAALLDEADRLTANLAFHLAARRAVAEEPVPAESPKEPHL